ncbi:MAG: hypothetical protein E3J30_04095 [Anaerolineales bacterium]|nr:MAG: hypothetical protein E3J30_04095 [Anaerolineales bacterium]
MTLTFQVLIHQLLSLKSFGVGLQPEGLASPKSFPHTSLMACVTGDFIMAAQAFHPRLFGGVTRFYIAVASTWL